MTPERFKVAVLASGRGSNLRAIAQSCTDERFPASVSCLITDNPKSAAVGVAEEFGIACFEVATGSKRGRLADGAEADIVRICESRGVELICLAGFMRILRADVLEQFAGRIINIHPSLLPSFKGLHAQQQALDYGAKVAGCTVHFVDDSVDGGPIIMQAAVPVLDSDDEDALSARILEQEHRILCDAIASIARGRYHIDGRRVIFDPKPQGD